MAPDKKNSIYTTSYLFLQDDQHTSHYVGQHAGSFCYHSIGQHIDLCTAQYNGRYTFYKPST